MKHKQRHNTILIATAGTLILVYLGFTLFFTNHFYFRTVINNIKCSGKTVKQVESLIAEEVSQYHLQLIERGGSPQLLSGRVYE